MKLGIASFVSNDLKYPANGPTHMLEGILQLILMSLNFRQPPTTRDHGLKPQNSEVFPTSSSSCVANGVDGNMRQEGLSYYGNLEDIIELNYHGQFWIMLFKCK